jgi:hypothetical protein
MKRATYLLLIIGVVSILGFLWFGNLNKLVSPGEEQTTEQILLTENTNSTVLPSTGIITVRDPAGASNVTAKYRDYLAGKINKAEMMKAVILEKNMQNQEFYGKVVDQYGSPVVGAIVKGNVMLDGLETSREETHTTETDQMGFFQFNGLHGASLGVTAKKDGYEMAVRGEGYKGPSGQKTSPGDRAIFTMWKFRGPEPLNNSFIDTKIPHDGTPIVFDTITGKQTQDGNLRVTLSQYPLEIKTGRERFDWTIKVELLDGGLKEENDPYPYWAPADGYQSSFEFNVSSNSPDWLPNLKKKFYIKNAQGQFGIMQFGIYPGRSPTGLEINFTINPSGSQNLEFDPAKQIQ